MKTVAFYWPRWRPASQAGWYSDSVLVFTSTLLMVFMMFNPISIIFFRTYFRLGLGRSEKGASLQLFSLAEHMSPYQHWSVVTVRQCGHSGQGGQHSAQATIKLRNVTIYCHHCHSCSLASVSTGQHTQWFLMAAKCAPSVPVLHTAAWCWCVTLPPDLSPIIQPSNQKSSQSNTNTSVRVFIDELNFCTLLEGDKLQVQWIVNIVHLRILHSNLWSPDGGNTIICSEAQVLIH